jgi:hypothetical protein
MIAATRDFRIATRATIISCPGRLLESSLSQISSPPRPPAHDANAQIAAFNFARSTMNRVPALDNYWVVR